MDYFNVVDALETSSKAIKIENINADDTKTLVDDSVSAHANIFPQATTSPSNETKKQNGKEMSETTTRSSTRKRTKTSDA